MEASKADSFFLRSTSALSLNERFSQVLMDQLTRSRFVTFNPSLLQQRRVRGPPPVVLLVKRETSSLPNLQTRDLSLRVRQRLKRRRRSVWTRLGWRQLTRRLSASRPRGFWSFKNKYRWRARFTSTYRRRTQLSLHLQRGGATAYRGRGWRKRVPTKKQLDAQLDDYMSMSKSRLDQQLDDYMSMSKSRLDAQLDEYMSMAGQTLWD